MSSSYFLVRVW